MATTTVFGIEIVLNDHAAPVSAVAGVGLYNVSSWVAEDAPASSTRISVVNASLFTEHETITVKENANTFETASIRRLDTGNNIIYLDGPLIHSYTAQTTGDGVVYGNSRFRWLQNDITGVSNWKSGMLVAGGIGEWTREIDLSRGGNVALTGTCGATVKNTDKFWDTLRDGSIYLNGLIFRVWEFSGTTKTLRWCGVCEEPEWDVKTYTIPAVGMNNKRIAQMGTLVTQAAFPSATQDAIGKQLPITIGEFKPKVDIYGNVDYDSYAEFVRTADKVDTFKTGGTVEIDDDGYVNAQPEAQSVFPVVGNDGASPPRMYKVQIGNSAQWFYKRMSEDKWYTIHSGVTFGVTYFGDWYVHVKDGDGDGEYRGIETAVVDARTVAAKPIIQLTVEDYFGESPAGNATATATDQSWVSLEKLYREYQTDVWPCEDYLGQDSEGDYVPVTTDLNLFSFDEQKEAEVTVSGSAETVRGTVHTKPAQYYRLPSYAYEDSADGNKNRVVIQPRLFDGDPDEMDAFVVVPMRNVALENTSLDSQWNSASHSWVETRIEEGVYAPSGAQFAGYYRDGTIASLSDKDYTSYYNMELGWPPEHAQIKAGGVSIVKYNLPSMPLRFDFDAVYLGLRYASYYTENAVSLTLTWRRFMGLAEVQHAWTLDPDVWTYAENLPDWYYTAHAPVGHNKVFYNTDGYSAGGANYVTGWSRWPFSGIGRDNYTEAYEGAIITSRSSGIVGYHYIRLYELAAIFHKKLSIGDRVFSPFRGRVFYSGWDGRKAPTYGIAHPDEVVEHACRLQNWSESSAQPTLGWGMGYADGARIGYTGLGAFSFGFQSSEMTPILDLTVANQITEKAESTTEAIKRAVCRDFWLASFVGADGSERLTHLSRGLQAPPYTVTLADIVDRKATSLTEPDPSTVFCEPYVRYQKDFATGDYQKSIRIKRADAEVYYSDYVEGLTSTAAYTYWSRCHELWTKIGFITQPPTELTDLSWANGKDADQIAQEYLSRWIDWMFYPTITFKVHYAKAGAWELTQRFMLTLPHETDNTATECIVTKLVVDPNPPYHVTVTAILLRETAPSLYYVKDSWNTLGNDYMWKDHDAVYGDNNDKKDTM